MKKKLTLLFALLCTMSVWATEVTTVATAGSYLTLDQLKALSGTGGHVAFANVGSGSWTNKWLANPSANSNLTLSTVQLYTLTDGSVSGKYYLQCVNDNKYRTNSGWGDLASAENIEFRAYTNSSLTVACNNPISIHNNSGTQWNINAGSFGGALNAWAAYAAYGPFYILEVTCIDDETSTTLYTSTQIVTDGHTMDIPTYAGKKLVDGSPASIEIDGADAVYELHYVASSFDYTLVVNGAVEGMTMTIKGDAITFGQTTYSGASAVEADDVVVTFPSEYSYMTATVNITGTTITINCEDTRWPVNFDKSQTFTRSDRHINSVSFNGQIVDGIYENTSTTCYQDLTATKTVVLPTGTSIKPSFSMTGIWQHGFVYIDLNNDGDFTDEGELVAKYNEGNPDLSTAIPAFTSPAVGTYRMRFKSDWASEDPGGNEGAEPGNVDGNNHIIKNGGMIVDVTLKTVNPFFRLYAEEESAYLQGNGSLTYGDATGNASIWYYDGTKLYNFSGGFNSAVQFSNAASAGYYITAGEALGNSFSILENVEALPVGISTAGYATLYSPVALTIPTGVTAYVATDEGKYLHLIEIEGGVIPANTGVILAGEENTYSFGFTTGGSVEINVLAGTIAAISRPEDSYILATGTSGVGFYKDGATTIPGFKAYLPASAGGEVKTFRFGDDATSINELRMKSEELNDGAIYNLAGQRMSKMQKGINIVNQKKVLY